jgi:hypothetical protein
MQGGGLNGEFGPVVKITQEQTQHQISYDEGTGVVATSHNDWPHEYWWKYENVTENVSPEATFW